MTGGASLSRLQVRHWGLVAAATALAALIGTPGAGGVLVGGTVMGASVLLYAVAFNFLTRNKAHDTIRETCLKIENRDIANIRRNCHHERSRREQLTDRKATLI